MLTEAEETELAMELLNVSSDAEMEQFFGKLFRRIGRGLTRFGGKVLKPLGGALRGIAKKALPFVGGALGSFIPIPGVGTAIGSALGGAVSKALELESAELESEEAQDETARRIVRVAASAAQQLGSASPGTDPLAAVREALASAARTHLPSFAANEAELLAEAEYEISGEGEANGEGEVASEGGWSTEGEGRFASHAGTSGQWYRQGRHIVLQGV